MKTNLSGQTLCLSLILVLVLTSVRGQKQHSRQLLSNSSSKRTAPVVQKKDADVIFKKTVFQENTKVNNIGSGSITTDTPSEVKQMDTEKTVDSRRTVPLVPAKQLNEEYHPKEEKITKMELNTTEAN